ncbi:MAG TPA: hypothetical protein VFA45_09730 [Actinomycetes bacterium]|jgi:hypothetical protein|nr:hypothetical protein [Actinomycetes bacterium]
MVTDPRRRLLQAIRRLRGNVTEIRHAAEALERDADYRTVGVPIPQGVWQAVETLEQWMQTIRASPPRRPWGDPPDS